MQRGRVRRAVFFLGALLAAKGLFGRNHPLEGAVLVHDAFEEVRVARNQGQGGAQKIGGVLRNGFLRLAVFDLFHNFREARVGRTEAGDPRIVLLNEAEKRNVGQIRRDAHLD